MALDVGYFRRWYGNFIAQLQPRRVYSLLRRRSASSPPVYARLPGGGGYTVGTLYNVIPLKFSVPANNFVTRSDTYGNQIQHWNGVDVNVNLRAAGGLVIQGYQAPDERRPTTARWLPRSPKPSPLAAPYCHQDTNWLTQLKLLELSDLADWRAGERHVSEPARTGDRG